MTSYWMVKDLPHRLTSVYGDPHSAGIMKYDLGFGSKRQKLTIL